jgi:hypothetical protein
MSLYWNSTLSCEDSKKEFDVQRGVCSHTLGKKIGRPFSGNDGEFRKRGMGQLGKNLHYVFMLIPLPGR